MRAMNKETNTANDDFYAALDILKVKQEEVYATDPHAWLILTKAYEYVALQLEAER